MPSKTIEDFAYQIKDYMRSAEVVKGKNYLYNNAPTTSTSHHINFTKNADLTITANGNNTDEAAAWVKINENVSLPNNDYVLSGGKSATKNISFTIGGTVYNDIGNGVQFTINNTVIPEIILYIKGEVDNEVFSPMICTLDEWNKSHDYEPYYVPVKDSKFDIADQQVLGAWNLLKYPYYDTTKSVSGLDYTDLGDGSVEADGTSTVSNNDFTCFSRGIMNYELEAGTYYVSGCPEGGSESTYHLRISKNKVYNNPSQGFDDLGIDTGDGFSFTLTEKSQLGVAIRIGQTSINHLIFKPMISLKPNQPYAPYAMTNRELTDKQNNPYIILATATASASTTYGDLFSVIKTAYNALPADKKARCEIWQNTNGSSLIFKNFAGIGVFTSMVVSGGNALFYIVRFDDNDYRKLTFSTNGTMTNADFSSQTQSQNLYLVMR